MEANSIQLSALLFGTADLLAFTYSSEISSKRKQDEHALIKKNNAGNFTLQAGAEMNPESRAPSTFEDQKFCWLKWSDFFMKAPKEGMICFVYLVYVVCEEIRWVTLTCDKDEWRHY